MTGDVGLAPGLASVELAPPLDGLAEELGYAGRIGTWRLLEIAPGQRNYAQDLLLFAVCRQGGAILAVHGGVYDPVGEPDFHRAAFLRKGGPFLSVRHIAEVGCEDGCLV